MGSISIMSFKSYCREKIYCKNSLILLFILYGIMKVFILVLHTPMYAYANNYDYIRVSHWYSLWPALDGKNVRNGHPSAPLPYYRQGPDVLEKGYGTPGLSSLDHRAGFLSSDHIFIDIGLKFAFVNNILLNRDFRDVSLKAIGVIRGLFLVLIAVFLTYQFYLNSWINGFISALIFSFAVSDPSWLLTLNTLYVDFSVLFFGYLSLGMLILLCHRKKWPLSYVLVTATAMFFLSMVKMQYFLLPFFLSIVFSILSWNKGDKSDRKIRGIYLTLIALFSLFGAGIQYKQFNRSDFIGVMRLANATDTYLGAVLPASRDKARALRILNLPDRCEKYIGKNWYSPGMQPSPCPEIADIRLFNLLKLFLSDVNTLIEPFLNGLSLTRPFYYSRVGHIADGEYQQYPANTSLFTFSISALITLIPEALYIFFIGSLLFIAVIIFTLSISFALCGRNISERSSFGMLISLTLLYSYGSALFGDGYFDLDRHFILGQVCIVVSLVVVSVIIILRSISIDSHFFNLDITTKKAGQ